MVYKNIHHKGCVYVCAHVWTYVYKKKILDFKVFQV